MKKSILFIAFVVISFLAIGQENCFNGIDDDGDGNIDLHDSECNCLYTPPLPLIPNQSFESNTCCPSTFSELNCASSWIQASDATSDYYHSCGISHVAGTIDPPPPSPSGNGYVGFLNLPSSGSLDPLYKEYVGACLLNTMLGGEDYKIEFNIYTGTFAIDAWEFTPGAQSPGINMVIYGSSNCGYLPFSTGFFNPTDCPLNANNGTWIELGSVYVPFSNSAWQTHTIQFTAPYNIDAMVIGPDCNNPSSEGYYYLDNLNLIIDEPSISPNISLINRNCNSELSINATTNFLDGTFQWYKDGIALPGETTLALTIDSISEPGTYLLLQYFDGFCYPSNTLTVEPIDPQIQISPVNAGCEDTLNNLDIEFTLIGDQVSQYFLDGIGQSSNVFLNVEASTHQFSATTVNGCFIDTNINVGSITTPQINTPDFTCLAYGTQDLELDVIGGAPPYIYYWNNVSTSQNPSPVLVQGHQNVTLFAVDSRGCSTDTIQTLISEGINASFTLDTNKACSPNCFSFENTINNSTAIDTLSYLYDLSQINFDSTSICISNPGVYDFQMAVIDTSGCRDTLKETLTLFELPMVFSDSTYSCLPIDSYQVNVNVVQGTPPFEYYWGANQSSSDNFTPIYVTHDTTLTVFVIDSNQCISNTKTFDITHIQSFNFEIENNRGCAPLCFELEQIPLNTTLVDTVMYELPSVISHNAIQNIYCAEQSGVHSIDLITHMQNQCIDTTSHTIEVYPMPTANFNVTPNDELVGQYEFTTINESSQANFYTWISQEGFASNQYEPVLFFEDTGNFVVYLVAQNNFGCTDTASKDLTIKPLPTLFVPNAFTPDGNDENDQFFVKSSYISKENFSFSIYDRWGKRVFNTPHLSGKWNGTFKSNPVPQGTYLWKVKAQDLDGNSIIKSGFVILAR